MLFRRVLSSSVTCGSCLCCFHFITSYTKSSLCVCSGVNSVSWVIQLAKNCTYQTFLHKIKLACPWIKKWLTKEVTETYIHVVLALSCDGHMCSEVHLRYKWNDFVSSVCCSLLQTQLRTYKDCNSIHILAHMYSNHACTVMCKCCIRFLGRSLNDHSW
jgi:hypothetical protein